MKYKLGDFVRFVDERLEGYVTRIIDEQMIAVTGEDDFEIPVLAAKVTYVHGHGQQAADEDAPETVTPAGEFKTKGIYIAVLTDQKANSLVHLHLVNETSYRLLASVTTEQQKQFKGEFAGMMEPDTAVRIFSAKLADLQLWPKFLIQILYRLNSDLFDA